jgi:flagella basal body P-ring formation protein FlgA
VKVSIHDAVVVATRPLSKGMIVRDQDVKLLEKDLAKIRSGYYQDLSEVIGKQVSRTVSMGTAITTSVVKPQIQIKRGQQIRLVAGSHGLKVQMAGEALADGASGELIRVRNLSTQKIIEGVVQSATTVEVAL